MADCDTIALKTVILSLQVRELNSLAESFTKLLMRVAVLLILDTSKNDQRWNAQENFSLAAVDLLLEKWVFWGQIIEIEAKVYKLISFSGVLQVLFSLRPRVLINLHDLH